MLVVDDAAARLAKQVSSGVLDAHDLAPGFGASGEN